MALIGWLKDISPICFVIYSGLLVLSFQSSSEHFGSYAQIVLSVPVEGGE